MKISPRWENSHSLWTLVGGQERSLMTTQERSGLSQSCITSPPGITEAGQPHRKNFFLGALSLPPSPVFLKAVPFRAPSACSPRGFRPPSPVSWALQRPGLHPFPVQVVAGLPPPAAWAIPQWSRQEVFTLPPVCGEEEEGMVLVVPEDCHELCRTEP